MRKINIELKKTKTVCDKVSKGRQRLLTTIKVLEADNFPYTLPSFYISTLSIL